MDVEERVAEVLPPGKPERAFRLESSKWHAVSSTRARDQAPKVEGWKPELASMAGAVEIPEGGAGNGEIACESIEIKAWIEMAPEGGEPTLKEVLGEGISRGGAARVGRKGKGGEGVPSLRGNPGVLGLGALGANEAAGVALSKRSHGTHVSEERVVDRSGNESML